MAFNSGFNNQGRFGHHLPTIPESKPQASSQEQAKDFPAPVQRQLRHHTTGKPIVSRIRSLPEQYDHYGPLQQNTTQTNSPTSPSELKSAEWNYALRRTAEDWFLIKHASEIMVKEEYSKETDPGYAYRLLGEAITRRNLNEATKLAIFGFLRIWPKRSNIPDSMDSDWQYFVQKSSSISKAPEEEYVHPAGDFSVPQPLSVIWDYPTYSTRQPYYVMTADTTNPCTRMLLVKGMNPSRTPMVWLEVLHRRLSTKDTKCSKSPLQMISPEEAQLARDFLRRGLNRAYSRVGLLLGNHAQAEYERHQSHSLLKLELEGHDPKWPIHVWVDGDPTTFSMKRVLVCCEHPMAIYFRHSKGVGVGKHMDRAIRIACELAGLRIKLNHTYFEYLEDERIKRATNGWNFSQKDSPINMLLTMLKYENEGAAEQLKVPYSQINPLLKSCYRKWTGETDDSEAAMSRYFDKNDLCPPHHVSIVKGLHALMTLRALATQAAAGWPNLAKGRALQAAAGHLVKGRAIEAAAGYPSLVKGRATMAAAGYPNLAKVRATMAAAGHPNLVTGRATRMANIAQRTEERIASGKDMWLCQADPQKCKSSFDTYDGYTAHMRQCHSEYWETATRGAKNCMYQRPKIILRFPANLLSSAEHEPET